MTVFEQVYQLVGSTEVNMYKMSVIEHISLKFLTHIIIRFFIDYSIKATCSIEDYQYL